MSLSRRKALLASSLAFAGTQGSSAVAADAAGSSPRAYVYPGNPTAEPVGGQPPKGAALPEGDIEFQLKRQRAMELVLWAAPAVAIYRFRAAAFEDLGLKDNDIIAYSRAATPKLEAITANSSTPYVTAFTDLRKGPVVLEVPAAGPDGSLYGQVVDAWQFTIADVGPSGIDKGKASKYLFTPPGFKGRVPSGYIHVASPNHRIALAFRSVVAKGKTQEDAFRYSHRLRMYYLSEAKSPPEQRFVDPSNDRYATIPVYDERHFADLHAIFTVEPVKVQDKVMMGMLSSLGIEKGKPYQPDESTVRAMREGTVAAWAWVQWWFDHLPRERLYWPDRHYASLMMADKNNKFTYEYEDRIDVLTRAAQFVWCTYVPETLAPSPATQYLMAMADKDGKLLEAGKLYKLTIPPEMPVKQFWALTVYDRATFGFIYTGSGRTTLSSYDMDMMKKNADGTLTLYVGPKAPDGWESNLVPTAGVRSLPAMRLYGPTEAINDKTFKMADFEWVA
ncbi:DUF1254 domain-containing protein [Variovorax sp. dw_954]|uniref:DUF1254 domain-containing protein n=1 Tax=Variovorax sp. dw_954 TaxID=2720078 RepID=UPI001BD212D2|nr:DUF1254 domain-containing protein [Variovorax sp. dw_954]